MYNLSSYVAFENISLIVYPVEKFSETFQKCLEDWILAFTEA